MNFIEKLLHFITLGFQFVLDAIEKFIEFLAVPITYLLVFLEGVFYFIWKLFVVVIEVIKLFVALFQFIGALIAGVFRTIIHWTTVQPDSNDLSFPSVSNQGFAVVVDILQPTGLMTVVPLLCTAFVWFYFILRIIALHGGSVMIKVGDGKK